MKDIKEINTETELGKYLLMAISKITLESQTDKTPNEVLAQLTELKEKVFTDDARRMDLLNLKLK